MAEDSIGGGATGAITGAASGAMIGAAGGPIGMVAGALLGGLFGSKKRKVPRPPSYSQIMNTNLDAQQGIQDKLLNLESRYRPRYQTLQEETLTNQLYGGGENRGYIAMLSDANRALAGVQGEAARLQLGTMAGLVPEARSMMLSPRAAAMQNQLMTQAEEGLAAGTGLTVQDRRIAAQTANEAMAMRGLSGRQGVAAGVLSNYGLGLQRQDRARQFAGNVMSQDSALQSAALQTAAAGMGAYGAGGAFMGQANAMLGQYQPQIFEPESQLGTQAQGMKYQHQMGLAMAKQQATSNMFNALGSFGAFAAMNPSMFNFGSIIPNNFGMGSMGATNFGGSGATNVGSLSAGGASGNMNLGMYSNFA